jgi:hypothetical protein
MSYFYRAFGLSVESAIECPELLPSEATQRPDIVISYGEIPLAPSGPSAGELRWQAAPGEFVADVAALGRFQVCEGRQIVVQPAEGSSSESLRLFLLGACLSILLHERRLFVLHCSGVATEEGAVLFAGKSGTGKSTMVSAFLERGYKIIADDMLALTFNESGQVMALPGFPQVKLWADSAKALGRITDGLRRVTPESEKFIAPETKRFSSHPAHLHAIYDLRIGEAPAPTLEPLAHAARFNILLDHTWTKAALAGLGVREWHFHTAARIASLTYAARLTRPAAPLDIAQAANLIEQDMAREHVLA